MHPLTKENKLVNKAKVSVHIIVEHTNTRLKTFKILSGTYHNNRKRFGLRFNLICAFVNHDRKIGVL
ncbi:MAG: transposase family protein [Sulfurimonas sp.]|nr:transposase family protein [Sulfurimonas sp.]MDD3060619.1 transposase family protein [Sulfurimonas sp.]MDD5202452.1 transposase family protein [Sulfurimonas sp.]